jgi:hypothetical protein
MNTNRGPHRNAIRTVVYLSIASALAACGGGGGGSESGGGSGYTPPVVQPAPVTGSEEDVTVWQGDEVMGSEKEVTA